MVDRIANNVCQRVLDRLQQRSVQLGFLSLQFQPHLLAASRRQVADHAWKLAPDVAHGLHPRFGDPFLQFARNPIQLLDPGADDRVVPVRHELSKLVARQHKFARQIHQLVQQREVDPDAPFADTPALRQPFARGGFTGLVGRLR